MRGNCLLSRKMMTANLYIEIVPTGEQSGRHGDERKRDLPVYRLGRKTCNSLRDDVHAIVGIPYYRHGYLDMGGSYHYIRVSTDGKLELARVVLSDT